MAGKKTQKSALYMRTGVASSFAMAKIDGIKEVNFPNSAPPTIDVSDLDSVEEEKVAGLGGNAAVSVNGNVTDTINNRLYRRQEKGTETLYIYADSDGTAAPTIDATSGVVTYPTTRSYRTWLGIYQGAGETNGFNDAKRFTSEIEVNGEYTYNDKA